MAFPRGETAGGFYDTGSYSSVESAASWSLAINDTVPRDVHLQASLSSLLQPFEPCEVTTGRSPLDAGGWTYDPDTGVLRARYRSDAGRLEVQGC